jgi:putative two-component system response regulator
MPLNVARDYLVENQGRQFDVACVEAFLSRSEEVVEIAAVSRRRRIRRPRPRSRPLQV